jgi:acyl-coenzyme A thioesterase PaaI-like protein
MKKNRLARMLSPINKLPEPLATKARSKLLGWVVPFAGHAGSVIEELNDGRCTVRMVDRRSNRNHIGGIHAAVMMLAAESATGLVCGFDVPDNKLLVVKSFNVVFKKRATGSVRAIAKLTPAQREEIANNDRGDIHVSVRVVDDAQQEPIEVEAVWAFRSKKS